MPSVVCAGKLIVRVLFEFDHTPPEITGLRFVPPGPVNEVAALLSCYGIATPASRIARTPEEVGLAVGSLGGKVAIKDKQAPCHYVLSGEGSGGPGFMQGDVSIDLEEKNGQTVLKYSTDARVGGLIASIGQRMLNGVAKMMLDQFFKKVETFI